MHYIRFLKQPRLLPSASAPNQVSAKITITTDLGESFCFETVPLCALLEIDASGSTSGGGAWKILASANIVWAAKDGYTGVEVIIPAPNLARLRHGRVRMVIKARSNALDVSAFENCWVQAAEETSGVVAVRSMEINVRPHADQRPAVQALAERVFHAHGKELHIWEEAGESIARHIWDAGLVLSSYLSFFSPLSSESGEVYSPPELLLLQTTLQKEEFQVLELGAGCGIVGISLATFFPEAKQVILTDLPEASEILTHNVSLLPSPTNFKVSHQVLDWSLPLPTNIQSTRWDLILVADCTYNPDVVPDLVKALGRLTEPGKAEALVVVAMKVRHESEAVFFDLMQDAGFVVKEKAKVPLEVLGADREEIEIFGFMRG
ncbi:hypothetical protein BP5796_07825 [Coleophoma crateriformis]|uniref:Uncharacterized protein n=1 Tax=Coleophoma crateriformis TaxID=565419 RepID=A0A3D8RD20_9HELO|nr:hypothetical protein BP5796_07825 [Coleophoma crateriformis]